MARGFPETYFPNLRPASNSVMAVAHSPGFVAGGEERHTVPSQRRGWCVYYVAETLP